MDLLRENKEKGGEEILVEKKGSISAAERQIEKEGGTARAKKSLFYTWCRTKGRLYKKRKGEGRSWCLLEKEEKKLGQ